MTLTLKYWSERQRTNINRSTLPLSVGKDKKIFFFSYIFQLSIVMMDNVFSVREAITTCENLWTFLTISYSQEEQQGEVCTYPTTIKELW